MLAGLAGVLLPVLAHLLSRKRYDTVDWGAMQFLELDPSARRNLRVEDLLLLLLRMGLMACVALALARPWFSGSWFGSWASTASRDVVIVIDGSYSMGWEGRTGTPHATAVRLANQFVRDLRGGDTVMILDAREKPQLALAGLTRDRERVRQCLDDLPAPSGTANLYEAIARGLQILAGGTNVQRELIVLTDQQALSWKPDDQILWARLDDLKAQSTLSPRIWVIDAAGGELGQGANFVLDRLNVSRELAVAGVPVRFSGKVHYRGGASTVARQVYVEVNGQRLADQTLRFNLSREGEASIEFERQFDRAGSQLISVSLDNDPLPGDNRADATVVVAESLPVVLVDGDRKLDPTRSETFFARAALASTGVDTNWIKPIVVTPDTLTAEVIGRASVVVLANVASLSNEALAQLERVVTNGRGLLVTLGDKVPKEGYALDPDSPAATLMPVTLQEIKVDASDSAGVRIAGNSLELPWLRQFRADKGGTLTDARFSKWWKVVDAKKVDTNGAVNDSLVIAKLTTGDPWIVLRRHGRGMTAVLTSTLDADWNTLPAKTDFVPWLHELLFSLASTSTNRNVDVGMPLVLNVPADLKMSDYEFIGPGNKTFAPDRLHDEQQPRALLNDAPIPGVYRFARKTAVAKANESDEFFVVNFDRTESDLTTLSEGQRQALAGQDRLTFVKDLSELRTRMSAGSSRTELWWLLIYLFLGMMSVEAWMTRRMLRGASDRVVAEGA